MWSRQDNLMKYSCHSIIRKTNNQLNGSFSNYIHFDREGQESRPVLGGAGPIVLCKTSSMLLCELGQPRVDNSSMGLNWLKAGPDHTA